MNLQQVFFHTALKDNNVSLINSYFRKLASELGFHFFFKTSKKITYFSGPFFFFYVNICQGINTDQLLSPEFQYPQQKPLVWPQDTALPFVTISDPAMLTILLGKWKSTNASSYTNQNFQHLNFWDRCNTQFHLFTHIVISVKSALFP